MHWTVVFFKIELHKNNCLMLERQRPCCQGMPSLAKKVKEQLFWPQLFQKGNHHRRIVDIQL